MLSHSKNAVRCSACPFLPDCGGLAAGPGLWGCFSDCLANCDPETCDLTCPNNRRLWDRRISEIGGEFKISAPNLRVPALRLPGYVPKIHNGSSRTSLLGFPVAAVPVRGLVRKSRHGLTSRFSTIDEVRAHFRLSPRTACIISCISTDDDVEAVWEALRYGDLAQALAKLKTAAIIVPNFSFFIHDVPRSHTIYNRKRISLAARMLSDAGCRVIIPLCAETQNDWDFWFSLLTENPAMRYVAKEFQTGLRGPRAANRAIDDLSKLQERLGRPLHPVTLGAGRYAPLLKNHFDGFTILDSRPFMLAARRRRLIQSGHGNYSEVSSPTDPNETIDALLQRNVRERAERFRGKSRADDQPPSPML